MSGFQDSLITCLTKQDDQSIQNGPILHHQQERRSPAQPSHNYLEVQNPLFALPARAQRNFQMLETLCGWSYQASFSHLALSLFQRPLPDLVLGPTFFLGVYVSCCILFNKGSTEIPKVSNSIANSTARFMIDDGSFIHPILKACYRNSANMGSGCCLEALKLNSWSYGQGLVSGLQLLLCRLCRKSGALRKSLMRSRSVADSVL